MENIGKKFGRLTVLRFDRKDFNSRSYYEFECECGNKKIIRIDGVLSGKVLSCGCYNIERDRTKNKDGFKISNHRIYRIAQNIINRCKNKNEKNYFQRGIECRLGSKAFEVYTELLKLEGYDENKQIDRIDNDGHYEVGNIRWSTRKENSNNTRISRKIEDFEKKPYKKSDFKNYCKTHDFTFEDFEQIDSNEKIGNHKKYYFKKIKR